MQVRRLQRGDRTFK